MNDFITVACICDGSRGIYIPKIMGARFAVDPSWSGVSSEDIEILACGPEHEHYWDAWDDALDNAIYTAEDGERMGLYQDGDLFLVEL